MSHVTRWFGIGVVALGVLAADAMTASPAEAQRRWGGGYRGGWVGGYRPYYGGWGWRAPYVGWGLGLGLGLGLAAPYAYAPPVYAPGYYPYGAYPYAAPAYPVGVKPGDPHAGGQASPWQGQGGYGMQCRAGRVSCALSVPLESGAACSCPGPRGESWGRVE